MSLIQIQARGIAALCSDLIIDPEDEGYVYFMSVCGYQVTVKGIIANFLEHSGLGVTSDSKYLYLTRAGFSYKTLLKKLPSGLVHGVVFPLSAMPAGDSNEENCFCLFAKTGKEPLDLFFRHLDLKTDIPLYPGWEKWLWNLFLSQEGWLKKLATICGSYSGYVFEFNPTELYDRISFALKKRIPEVSMCFKRKGGQDG